MNAPAADDLLRTLMENGPHPMAVFNREGRYVGWNDTLARFSGIPASGRLGKKITEIPPPFPGIDYHAMFAAALGGETVTIAAAPIEYRETGVKGWMELKLIPVRDASGDVRGVLAIGTDFNDAKAKSEALAEKERELRHALRMEAVGRIAGGVAHDFNNILTAILSFTHLAARELPADHAVREDLDEVTRAAERAAQLARQLLLFTRPAREPSARGPIDVPTVVQGLQKMVGRVLGEDIAFSVLAQPGLPAVVMPESELEEIVMNLAVNARDAMPTGGVLTIRVTEAAGGLELAVADTGTGIPEEIRTKIFEPFFSTKAPGKGTGLGLSVVADVVRKAGGSISVDSTVGVGTTFRIRLPAAGTAPGPAPEPVAREPIDGRIGAGRVALVVEDDSLVRTAMTRALRAAGFSVVNASDSYEGISALEKHDQIDVLLTDIVLPGVPGTNVAALGRLRFPEMRVVYMTGYPREKIADLGVNDGPVLTKPFHDHELFACLRPPIPA